MRGCVAKCVVAVIVTVGWAGISFGAEPSTRPAGSPPATGPTTKPRELIKVTSKDGKGLTVLVDVNEAPEVKEWALKAANYAIEVYPKIAAALPSDGYTPPNEVTLYFKPMNGVAFTTGRKITVASQWITKHPSDIGLVGHELTHVVQHYGGGNKDAGWVTEGVADYVRYYVLEVGTPQARFNAERSSYKNGYQPAAGMLNWLEKEKGPGFVQKLNAICRAKQYTPEKFKELTGQTPDEAWEAFKGTLGKK